jgi:hypothetical protein
MTLQIDLEPLILDDERVIALQTSMNCEDWELETPHDGSSRFALLGKQMPDRSFCGKKIIGRLWAFRNRWDEITGVEITELRKA